MRGTEHPNVGATITPETSTLAMQGRGIYMVQAEDAGMVERYGKRQDLRVNVKNPVNFYDETIRQSPEYKSTLEHLKKHPGGGHWQTQDAIAFQAAAQSRGHDATYYDLHEKKPEGGERKTGRVVLVAWDAAKVAVVKD